MKPYLLLTFVLFSFALRAQDSIVQYPVKIIFNDTCFDATPYLGDTVVAFTIEQTINAGIAKTISDTCINEVRKMRKELIRADSTNSVNNLIIGNLNLQIDTLRSSNATTLEMNRNLTSQLEKEREKTGNAKRGGRWKTWLGTSLGIIVGSAVTYAGVKAAN